jgi:hypothetical protein
MKSVAEGFQKRLDKASSEYSEKLQVTIQDSWYFRNALVRANYNNYPAGVSETTEYLELFLRNLLLNEDNELKNRYLHIRWNDVKQDIEETKQDIEPQKQDIEPLKQDIFIPDEIGNKTKQHILRNSSRISLCAAIR